MGYWFATLGGGVGGGVGVPLVIGVPFPHAAKKLPARNASNKRAVRNNFISLGIEGQWISRPLLADRFRFPPRARARGSGSPFF
jgi:hypothetical protein